MSRPAGRAGAATQRPRIVHQRRQLCATAVGLIVTATGAPLHRARARHPVSAQLYYLGRCTRLPVRQVFDMSMSEVTPLSFPTYIRRRPSARTLRGPGDSVDLARRQLRFARAWGGTGDPDVIAYDFRCRQRRKPRPARPRATREREAGSGTGCSLKTTSSSANWLPTPRPAFTPPNES